MTPTTRKTTERDRKAHRAKVARARYRAARKGLEVTLNRTRLPGAPGYGRAHLHHADTGARLSPDGGWTLAELEAAIDRYDANAC